MKIPILAHPRAEDLPRIHAAVTDVNRLQNYFRLEVRKAKWLPNGDKEVSADEIRNAIERRYPTERPIAVINNGFDDNYFSHEYRSSMITTVWDWEALYAPPSLKVYLAYEFAGGMLNFAADLGNELLDGLEHNPSIGCFFDFCGDKQSITLGMVGANLCGNCESALCALGLSNAALRAVERVLGFVRTETIRRPTSIPFRVFVGHGHNPAWKDLERFLSHDLKLDVVEFNRDPVAGTATTERLMDMLDQSCFAFIVMTGEDTHGDRKKHARPNVIHEAGLFQGRLGFKRAVVLKEQGCESFSNISGLTDIRFPKGKLLRAKKDIVRALSSQGIL